MKEEKEMLSVGGYRISPELFATGMSGEGGPCACTSTCCRGGVYADIRERDRILEHRDIIARYMDETQPADPADWFETHESDDEDFTSGRCVGTTEHNGKCAFLDKFGRCSTQVAAMGEGMDRWALKPLYCILFPIEVSAKVVGFDNMLQDDERCCSVSETYQVPLFRSCRDELIHLLGEDAFKAMEDHYRTVKDVKVAQPAGVRER